MHYPFDLPAPVDRIQVMGPHMTKHYLSNWQVVHQFTGPDTGFAHDHPFPFESEILQGGYEEEEYILHPDGTHTVVHHIRLPGTCHHVEANTVHRITRLLAPVCWTLLSPGHKVKVWGFYRFESEGIYRRNWNGRWKLFLPRLCLPPLQNSLVDRLTTLPESLTAPATVRH